MFRTANFPAYRQLDQMDCGPTCLKIITDFLGGDFHLDYLRQISCLQKGGVSVSGLTGALEKIGIPSLGITATIDELIEEMPLPAIAHWQGNHFLVIYKVSRRYVYVSDPALGRMKYTHREFLRQWAGENSNEGVLILIEPRAQYSGYNPSEFPTGSFNFLLNYLQPYKKYFHQIFLGLFLASLIQLILPFLTQSLVDYGINYENIGFIYLIVIAQLLLFISLAATEVIRDWILLHLSTRINIVMISDFLDRLLKLPISYFDSKTTGDFMQRIYDHHRIDEFLGGRFLTILFDLFTILAFGVVLAFFNTTIFLIFLIGTVFFITWSVSFMKKKEILDHQLFDLNRKEQSLFLQIFRAVLEIKLNNSEHRRKSEWKQNQTTLFHLQSRSLRVDQAQVNGGRFINEFMKILIIFWSAKAVISGDISLGTMLAIQFIVGGLTMPVANLTEFMVSCQRAMLSLNRLSEIHGQKVEDQVLNRSTKIEPGEIRIKDMFFGYGEGGGIPILKSISVSIPLGKTTAIVGPSGSGKTTVLKLLLKIYSPKSGKIYIGRERFEDINSESWRKLCGSVLQDGVLFNDTIERNITESNSNVPTDHEQLKRAIRMVNLTELIESLPLGFETRIGEQGQLLSGGEKQRLLIARAVYKDPEYLFFDEATSSLDAENEKVISENLADFYKNKTVIIIAHRLSTVKKADQILVMNQGSIVEQGNHLDLIARGGRYHKLIKNQLSN
ncbi:peptidase domain-containing ABC transporter [Salinimicrobium sp. CAU 1759]